MRVKVNGEIVMSDDKWIYDWFELENTAPSDIRRALEDLPEGEDLVLEINSGGSVLHLCLAHLPHTLEDDLFRAPTIIEDGYTAEEIEFSILE